jgi:hypothetical protein
VNVVSYNGGKVHSAMPGMPEDHAYPLCRGGGMNQMVTTFRTIDAPLTCKTCLTYAERRAAKLAAEDQATTESAERMPITIKYNRTTNHLDGLDIRTAATDQTEEQISATGEVAYYAENACGSLTRYRFAGGQSFDTVGEALEAARAGSRKLCKTCERAAEAMLAAESANITSDSNAEEGEIMAEMKSNDVSTDEGKAVLEQIDANIERASSLAEAENVEGLKELEGETETLISSLSGKGSIKVKTEKREAFRAAATVQEKPKAEVAPVVTYDQIPGVPELIDMGVEKAVEGVRLHLKAVDTARELAKIGLDMWLRMENKKKFPDLMGDSDQAKKSSKALNDKIGQALAKEQGLSEYEVVQAVAKFSRSIQTQRSNVRAQFLRSLDDDTEEAAEAREVFADVLKDKPKDVPVSRWVADAYGTSLVGQTEIDAIEYHIKRKGVEGLPEKYKAIAAYEPSILEQTGAAQLEAAANPDDALTSVVDLLESEFKKVEKLTKRETIESASEDVKKAQRERLEPLFAKMKELIAATL